jgi:hypothetical protein
MLQCQLLLPCHNPTSYSWHGCLLLHPTSITMRPYPTRKTARQLPHTLTGRAFGPLISTACDHIKDLKTDFIVIV